MGDRLLKSRSGNVVNEDGIKFHSQQYNLTVTGWSTVKTVGHVYSVSDGAGGEIWRISLNLGGTIATTNAFTLTIDDITFEAFTPNGVQALAAYSTLLAINDACARTRSGSGEIDVKGTSNTTEWAISGDVQLTGKPSFVA